MGLAILTLVLTFIALFAMGGPMMQCEITTCYRCGADIHGDRWKLTMYSQAKPYSWKAIN